MAVSKIFQNNRYQAFYFQYVADTTEDIKKIKVSTSHMGSEVYVIETQKTYILDSKGVWHSKVDNDTIVCDCVEESTIWQNISDN